MKVRIKVGEVDLRVEGLELTKRQVKDLLTSAASIAVALTTEPEPEPERPPLGFSAHIERAETIEEDLSEYFEDRL